MARMPKKLIKEAGAMIRLYFFLRHDCGLKEADSLRAKDFGRLFKAFLENRGLH